MVGMERTRALCLVLATWILEIDIWDACEAFGDRTTFAFRKRDMGWKDNPK
jgi:hypothetical protein